MVRERTYKQLQGKENIQKRTTKKRFKKEREAKRIRNQRDVKYDY